jgi:glutathione S-transferase
MALCYAGVKVDIEEVDLRHKPAGLLAASPKATVPVLVTTRGEVIDQSLDIMRWALAQNDPEGWLATRDPGAGVPGAEHWIDLNDVTFKPLLDRYKYASQHPQLPPAEHRRQALEALILPLEAQLQTTPWLAGTRAGLADVALFPFVRQFAGVDTHWFSTQALPAVQAWLNAWLASALFRGVMDKPASR